MNRHKKKNPENSNIEQKNRRKDYGKSHKKSRYYDVILRRYSIKGTFEAEFYSIEDAVVKSLEEGIQGVTYAGVYCCINGRARKHAGKIWRCDKGRGVGILKRSSLDRDENWIAVFKSFVADLEEGYTTLRIEAFKPKTGERLIREFDVNGKEIMQN